MKGKDQQPVTVVLGGTGAVGQTLAGRLLQAGHHIVIGARDRKKLEQSELSGDVEFYHVDATEPGTIESCLTSVKEAHGRLSGVANCIGSILFKPAHLTTDDELADVLTVNLNSAFETIRGAAKTMRSNGGSVVLVSTSAARVGIPNHEAIAAAKSGVEGLARSAAATYASAGVRVNVVAPGLVKSEMSRSIWSNPTSAAASEEMHALGRLGEPDDVAAMIAWLLDPDHNWITGQVIAVDGGLSSVVQRQRRTAHK